MTILFSRRQKIIAVVIGIVNFCSAICVSLQAPFYPHEAEKKGATATGYGLVFGVFELTVFVASPLMGKNLRRMGVKRTFTTGIFCTGTCCILFGVLDCVNDGIAFISMSFVIRSMEAVGNSGFLTASFSIIAQEFPEAVAIMFSSLEMCFGFGLIVGPSIGAYLYDIGGYMLPFVTLGSCLVLAAVLTLVTMPKLTQSEDDEDIDHQEGIMDALKIPSITLSAFSIFAASISIGFIQATLEPHMRRFRLRPLTMGLMFVINGGMYALTAPIWGCICDMNKSNLKVVTITGSVLVVAAFVFLGPAPFVPIPIIYEVCIATLIIHGIGIAAMLVAGFADAHAEAVRNGFPDNLNTYGLISGLWTSSFALGAFVGPSLGGFMTDRCGFRWATVLVSGSSTLVALSTAFYVLLNKIRRRKYNGYNRIENCHNRRHRYDQYGSFDSASETTGYGSLDSGSSISSGTRKKSRRNKSLPNDFEFEDGLNFNKHP